MIENRDQKNQIFYFKECGWNVSCYDIEKIYGEKDGDYFCYQCGKNLIKKEDDSLSYIKHNSQINNEYSLDFLAYCELLYEEIGSIRAICRKLEQEGYIYERRKLKSKLEKKFEQEGRDFKEWTISFYNDNSERHYLIGKYIHWILECLFIEYTLKHDLKGFFEIMPNRLNGSLKSVDNVLLKSPFNIINFDYTISTHKSIFLNKCKKGYQSLNRRLILVSLNIDNIEGLLRNNKYPYMENVEIFDTKKFAEYMKYYGNYLENYYDAINIMKESFTDDFFLKKLIKTAKEAKIKLEKFLKIYAISQEDYELEIRWWNKY